MKSELLGASITTSKIKWRARNAPVAKTSTIINDRRICQRSCSRRFRNDFFRPFAARFLFVFVDLVSVICYSLRQCSGTNQIRHNIVQLLLKYEHSNQKKLCQIDTAFLNPLVIILWLNNLLKSSVLFVFFSVPLSQALPFLHSHPRCPVFPPLFFCSHTSALLPCMQEWEASC